MTLSDTSIKNPVFAWMIMLALVVFGAIAFSQIGQSQLPDVDFPVLTVSLKWEGASPEVIETEVVDAVEDSLTSVKGVKKISSVSRQGQALVTIEFDLKTDVDIALQEVQSKISQTQYELPKDMDPPIISKFNPDDQPFMWISLSGDRPERELMDYVKNEMKDKFTTIPGVGDVFLGGFVEPAVRVWLDPEKMRLREITVDDMLAALRTVIRRDLLLAWHVGRAKPLPVAVKTAFAWLGQTDPAKAAAAASKAYEGDGINTDGERRETPALTRQFPDYAALVASEAFEGWCETLYRPLINAAWRSLTGEEAGA